MAGVVEQADEDGKFSKGDKVFALTPGYFNATPEGCYAEYVAAEADWVARVPDNLPLEQVHRCASGLHLCLCGLGWEAVLANMVWAEPRGCFELINHVPKQVLLAVHAKLIATGLECSAVPVGPAAAANAVLPMQVTHFASGNNFPFRRRRVCHWWH